MKITRALITLFAILILTNNAKTENPCGVMFPQDTSSWGIGFIRLPQNVSLIGTTCNTETSCYIGNGKIRFSNDSTQKIDWKDLVFIDEYYHVLLKVFKINDTKYKICSNSIEESIWIEFEEFNSKGLHFNTYLSMLKKNMNNVNDGFENKILWTSIGVNLINSCLNLRTEPSTNGEIVTCLNNNIAEDPDGGPTHLVIMGFNGSWAYILARDYAYDPEFDDADEGCSYKVIKEYRGYVKAIGDNGRPNIWYAVR